MLFNILLYALMAFMIFRMFTMNKAMKKNRQVISVVSRIADPDDFFTAADELISTAEDAQIVNKTKIIKLWGMVYHERYDDFVNLLNEIEIDPLISRDKKGLPSIERDEDSFFYLLLAIPNMLYGNGRNDLRKLIEEKMKAYDTMLEDQLSKAVADHCALYYDGKDDLGESFFRNVDEGDYPGYRYSKQLIGLYKNICDTMLIRILRDRDEDASEYEDFARSFSQMGVGKRWLTSLKMEDLIEKEPEFTDENEPEEPEESEEPEDRNEEE